MDLTQIRDYCLSKPHVEESFPFDQDTLVFKVMGKMYALLPLKKWESGAPSINLKCDPEYAIELRDLYHSIQPGFHMSKKHWNTIYFSDLDLEPQLVLELIDHSYNLVVKGLPAKLRKML